MKIKAFAPLLALFLLALAAPQVANAQAAAGSYKFAFEDGAAKTIEFDARGEANGSAVGQMYLTDEATLVYRDVDGTGESGKYAGYYISAVFDGMVVDKNKAVMSGTIRDSNVREILGKRILLTVEDNGDNTRIPDRLTWGIYNDTPRTWTPSDYERKDDPGVGLRWWAKDAEREREDVGYAMPRDESTTTMSFPMNTYAFADLASESGDIRVSP